MMQALGGALSRWSADPIVYAVALTSDGPGLGLGLDWDEAEASPYAAARLHWQAECFTKPTVALIDGVAEDLSLGLVLCGTHRVATAHSTFRVTSAQSGRPPDPFALWMLSQLPDRIGHWAALTAAPLTASDALELGLVTHIVEPASFPAIAAGLADADPVDPLLDRFAMAAAPSLDRRLRAKISQVCGAPSLAEVRAHARQAAATDPALAALVRGLEIGHPAVVEVVWQLLERIAPLPMKEGIEHAARCAGALLKSSDALSAANPSAIAGIVSGAGEPPFALPERRKTLPPIT